MTHLILPAPSLILLCGHRRQRVALFAERIIDHLEHERPDLPERPERPRVVPPQDTNGRSCVVSSAPMPLGVMSMPPPMRVLALPVLRQGRVSAVVTWYF